jgi:transposase
MDALVARQSFSNHDKRVMIKFHLLLGKSPLEIHQVMEQALQDFCPSYETVRRWVVAIRAGKEDLDDEPRTGRPVTATFPDVKEKVAAAMRQDRRLTTRQMSEMVGVSHNSVHKILTENQSEQRARNCMPMQQSSCKTTLGRIANARCWSRWSRGTGRRCLTLRTRRISVLATFFSSRRSRSPCVDNGSPQKTKSTRRSRRVWRP